jgi:hypothetical protein
MGVLVGLVLDATGIGSGILSRRRTVRHLRWLQLTLEITPTRPTPTRLSYVPLWRVTMATPIFAKIRIPPNAPPSQVTITRKAFSALRTGTDTGTETI